jgi:hypothetical protein
MFQARQDGSGVWVTDEGGLPITIEEAKYLYALLGQYIQRSEAEIARQTRHDVATKYPYMYDQIFGEVLPKEYRRDPVKLTPQARKSSGYVYLMHGDGTEWYKIGHSVNPVTRAAAIGVKAPFEVNLLVSYWAEDRFTDEAIWHRRFETKRVNGEWFALSPEDVSLFQQAC